MKIRSVALVLALSFPFASLPAQAADPAPASGAAAVKPAASASSSNTAPGKPAAIAVPNSSTKVAAAGNNAGTDARSSAGPVKVASTGSQQNRMKECNKQATGKKGAERKAFMKSCLSTRKS